MKKNQLFIYVFAFFALLVISTGTQAQTYPQVVQEWQHSHDNKTQHIESFWSVNACSSTSTRIFIRLFNEKPLADTVTVTVVIYNDDKSESTTSSFQKTLTIGEMANPECGTNDHTDLSLAIPSGYDPKKLTVNVSTKK